MRNDAGQVGRCCYRERQAYEERDVHALEGDTKEDGDSPDDESGDAAGHDLLLVVLYETSKAVHEVVGDRAGRRDDETTHRAEHRGEGYG